VTAADGPAADSSGPDFDPGAYGRHIADVYDELHEELDPRAAAERVAELAGGGPVLELGIGTGRIALPLLERGLEVHGIEGSSDMLAALRSKERGAEIPVTVGDFSTVSLADRFSVALLAYNTIFALPDQEAQLRCFRRTAEHLRPGGCFVVEAWVPDLQRFHRGRAVTPLEIGAERVIVEVAELRPADQVMRTTKLVFTAGDVRLLPANHRYAWPAELDAMAGTAGLRLDCRWADWEKSPFDDASTTHVSVYRKDGG